MPDVDSHGRAEGQDQCSVRLNDSQNGERRVQTKTKRMGIQIYESEPPRSRTDGICMLFRRKTEEAISRACGSAVKYIVSQAYGV